MNQPVKVLIVDDEEMIRLNLRALLEDLGYQVIEAVNGREGLDVYDRERPDVVLADLRMPVMDGLSMISGLRERSSELPVIVVSGTGTVRSAVDSLRFGAWEYIIKPIADAEELDVAIRRVLEKARLVRENRLYREQLEKTAEVLRASEERYALAVAGANDVIWDLNLLTGEAYHSSRYKSILGYGENEMANNVNVEEWRERIHPDDCQKVRESTDACLEGRLPVFEVECRLRHKDGSYIWVDIRGACVRDHQGRPYRMAGSLTDITKRKMMEQQLLQSQKMESVGILAGGMAHEFNNLLTGIYGYGQMLQETIPADDELSQESIGNVLQAARRAAELTRGLLAFSRKQLFNAEIVAIDVIIDQMGKLIQKIIGEDIAICVKLSGENLLVNADAGQIEQVLINLATNARDAMPRGGHLSVTTSRVIIREGSEAEYDLPVPGSYAQISVGDSGTGIDRESLGKIFEPFYTTREVGKGTGLGLSIVHGIIKQHKGSILAESEPGKGTTFNIYLPLVDSHAVEDRPRISPPHVTGMETLLVAEDDEIVRGFMQKILQRAGYRVIPAENGEDAVERFKEHDDISLVLSDVVMPEKSGKEALDEIRRIKPDIKVMFISGYTADAIEKKGMFEEGAEFIMKPFKKDILLQKVRKMLDGA